jgi:hypothetical protein
METMIRISEFIRSIKDLRLKIIITVVVLAIIAAQHYAIHIESDKAKDYKDKSDRMEKNFISALQSAHSFMVSDSLKASQLNVMSMTASEYARLYTDERELNKKLKIRNSELVQSGTFTITKHDTIKGKDIIVRDTLDRQLTFSYDGQWMKIKGIVGPDSSKNWITYLSRDSLNFREYVKYKKFLFFYTRKIKDRRVVVVSSDPKSEPVVKDWKTIIEK